MDHTPNTTKMRSDDRILVLVPLDEKNPEFRGDNKLHARLNKQNMFWTLHYEKGIVPPALQQSFTSFTKCLNFATEYYKRRNIAIKEIVD